MFTSLENRLWLAVHLLYPNSSQAFDVYQALVLQSEDALANDNRILIFSKLSLLFEKIPSVSSNLSFYEFEFDQIDQWKIIYKNSQKAQLLIFIGVLIFDLKISEIAPCAKLTKEKAQFLFHQIFKKLSQHSGKAKYNEQLNFKKQNDQKISYLYTYENLVEYCLGQLSEEETAKVTAGIELYSVLQTTRDEYQKIINQIQNLKVQRSNSTELKSKNRITLLKTSEDQGMSDKEKITFYSKKKVIVSLFSTLAVVLIFLQVSGVLARLRKSEKTVVMSQIVKKPEFAAIQPDIAVDSLPNPAAPVVTANQEQTITVTDAPKSGEVTVTEPGKKVVPINASTAKDEGGLYRGTLIVKNLNSANVKLMAKLANLGAKKAGEVELGWLKSNNLAYYHFILKDENIEGTKTYLRELGTLKIRFESHPRLISAGNKRFIIEVKGN